MLVLLATLDRTYNEIQLEYEEGIKSGKKSKEVLKKIATTRIKEADEGFLKEIYAYAPESTYDKAAKYAALGGIGTKYLGERILGTIYPRFRARINKKDFMDAVCKYANANSQTTIGIWEDMGRHRMIKLGNGITPEILYGKTLKNLSDQNQHRQVAGEVQSSACQGRFIDNRIEYWYHNGIYDNATRESNPKSVEQCSYLPALIASASIYLKFGDFCHTYWTHILYVENQTI